MGCIDGDDAGSLNPRTCPLPRGARKSQQGGESHCSAGQLQAARSLHVDHEPAEDPNERAPRS